MRSVRFIVVAFWFAALVGFSSSAFGHYQTGGSPSWIKTITQSGTVSGDFGMPPSFSYDPSKSSDGYSISQVCSGPAYIPTGKTGNINRVISYHVKFVWQNADGSTGANPASQLLVQTIASASWHGPTGKATGSCVNGISSAKTTATSGAGETMAGEKWEVKDSSSGTVEYDIPTSAKVTVTGQVNPNTYSCSTSVSANVYAITLSLAGTVTVPNSQTPQVLIGQNVTGTVTVDTFDASKQSGWQWSVGGMTLQSWNVASDRSSASVVLGPGRLDGQSFTCCWLRGDLVNISCKFKLSTPNAGLVDLECKGTLNVMSPAYDLSAVTGTVMFASDGSKVMAGDVAAVHGITFTANATTPAPFNSQGNGTIQFVQLVKASFNITKNGMTQPVINDPDMGLDNKFPYSTASPADDSPYHGLDPLLDSAKVNDQYEMYLIYTPPSPPGIGVQTVPLAQLKWDWFADCTNTNGTWGPVPPGNIEIISNKRWYNPPTWTRIDVNRP